VRTKLTIRSKLAAALALPLVAASITLAVQLRDESMVVYGSAAAGAVVLSVLMLVLANVWITRPLRRLADDARAVADERLPETVATVLAAPSDDAIVLEPVRGRGGAEIVEVAEALNALQRRAVELAAEQAALRRSVADALVNLGRRMQQLLSRQIDTISQLEAKEQNPELLEKLFKLDHLATRMRRNAESLLVLAGEEAPRQWRAAQPASDLVRAAIGEVEDYARVRIHQLDDATIVGHAVADISHVLAELLENGLSFSPPESVVDVWGRLLSQGYVVSISDHGIGMSAPDMARANERVAATDVLTVAPARHLGHYVVAQLAGRHGVRVVFSESPGGGVTVNVVVPPALVEGFEAPPAPSPAPPPQVRAPDPAPAPEPEREPEPLRTPAYVMPRSEPYAELVQDRIAREAEEIAASVEEVKETATAFSAAAPVDDLLPRLPRRRDSKRAPLASPVVPAPEPTARPAEPAEPAPMPEDVQSNMAVYAAFRAAAERGRQDANHPGYGGRP